jgi:hypothetical protein
MATTLAAASLSFVAPAGAQSLHTQNSLLSASAPGSAPDSSFSSSLAADSYDSSKVFGDAPLAGPATNAVVAAPEIPAAPEPAVAYDHYAVAPSANWHQIPFSRIGIGGDINFLGIGIKSAIVLNHYFDARLMGNFFFFDSGRFEVESFNIDANMHFASGAASLDFYPFGSVWRISPGVIFYNGNKLSGTMELAGGQSFTPQNQIYYSAYPNAATGATPLKGTGVLGLNTNKPAFTIAGGFGKYIPRSNRHWSFPSEFGVAFTGPAKIAINTSGWVCTDEAQTHCADVGNPNTQIGQEFNADLQSRITKWQKDLNKVTIYPLFSYSVMYSFNIR